MARKNQVLAEGQEGESGWVLVGLRIRIPVVGVSGAEDSKRRIGDVKILYEFIDFRDGKQVVSPIEKVPREVKGYAGVIKEVVQEALRGLEEVV